MVPLESILLKPFLLATIKTGELNLQGLFFFLTSSFTLSLSFSFSMLYKISLMLVGNNNELKFNNLCF